MFLLEEHAIDRLYHAKCIEGALRLFKAIKCGETQRCTNLRRQPVKLRDIVPDVEIRVLLVSNQQGRLGQVDGCIRPRDQRNKCLARALLWGFVSHMPSHKRYISSSRPPPEKYSQGKISLAIVPYAE